MTNISDYGQAVAVMAKARKPGKGKPLGPSGWRMFKDGDEFAVYYKGTMIARFLPDNTLRMVCNDKWAVTLPSGVTHNINEVLPVALVGRGKGHYRLHVRGNGMDSRKLYSNYGTADWDEWSTGGCRLYNGLTIDLLTRKPIGYVEPKQVIDTEARVQWLKQLQATKRQLKTVAKLGGFTARTEQMTNKRWEVPSFYPAEDLPLLVAALRDGVEEVVTQRIAELMYRDHYRTPTVTEQCAYIDRLFNSHSTALRTALGVIK